MAPAPRAPERPLAEREDDELMLLASAGRREAFAVLVDWERQRRGVRAGERLPRSELATENTGPLFPLRRRALEGALSEAARRGPTQANPHRGLGERRPSGGAGNQGRDGRPLGLTKGAVEQGLAQSGPCLLPPDGFASLSQLRSG